MNVSYTGKVLYNGKLYDGEHEAVIDEGLFEKVQERIKYNRHDRKIRANAKCAGLLSQLLRCKSCDCPMIHTYSVKDKVKKYRYYVCIKAQKLGYATCPTRSVNAQEIEDFTFHGLRHTVATRLAQSKIDLYRISKLLGHKDISTTQLYAHHCSDSLRDGVEILEVGYNLTTVGEKECSKNL